MAEHLNRTIDSVNSRINRMLDEKYKSHKFSDEDNEIIIKNYPDHSANEISKMIGHKAPNIRAHYHYLKQQGVVN